MKCSDRLDEGINQKAWDIKRKEKPNWNTMTPAEGKTSSVIIL
jgi:hypothetical protein